jgi:hypothetical protein
MVAEPDTSMLALDCSAANMVKKRKMKRVPGRNAVNGI